MLSLGGSFLFALDHLEKTEEFAFFRVFLQAVGRGSGALIDVKWGRDHKVFGGTVSVERGSVWN